MYKKPNTAVMMIISILTGFLSVTIAQTIDEKVESLLKKMTLEEKIGQMNQYNGFWDATGPVPVEGYSKERYDHVKKGLVGSMLNVQGTEQVRKMQQLAVDSSRLGIPMMFGLDVVHGYKTMSPIPLAETASWDLQAIEKSARIGAIEAAAVGINWTFAPMVDISRDARWGRVMEGAGEDPYLGSAVARVRVKGFQGNDLAAHNTIAATGKHFAAYGFAEAGRDYNTVDIGTSTLYNFVLPPFKAAVESDVKTIMNSFNIVNGIPATGDRFLQRDLLKGEWGFKGFIISDWSSGREMIAHRFARDLKHVAELSANAGSDMDMESSAYIAHLKEAVEQGTVKVSTIDDAVRRILRVKYELGLFDDPYLYCSMEREQKLLHHPEHHKAALDMARKSIVLLKNENNVLPLKKDQLKIACIGALAEEKNSPLGSWRAAADAHSAVSVLEGLQKYNSNIKYEKGPGLFIGEQSFFNQVQVNETDTSGFDAAINLAKESDVVIMVLGEHGFQSGEGRSRTKLDFPGLQQELLETIFAVNKNVVLVVMSGRPLVLTWAAEHAPAILQTWHLGSQSGNAIADVLFAAYNPAGKLPMSFPRSVGQLPLYYNHYNTGRPGPNEDVFWSHYIDEENSPLYPFGYGLSYTTFEYSDLKIDASDKQKIMVSAKVKNTGNLAGEEVAQLYISDMVASVVRPVKELKGFEKFLLQPNESKEVQFELTDNELGFYNNKGEFIVEPGTFEVMVGSSSHEGLKGELQR